MRFARDLYKRFAYAIPFAQNKELRLEIKKIIADVEKRIKMIPTNWGKKGSSAVEQHMHLKKETDKQHYRPRPFDPISAEPIYGDLILCTPNFPQRLNIRSTREFFGTDGLTNNLYFELNQRRTAKNAGASMEAGYLKPIDFLLVLIPERGDPMAVVTCNEVISGFIEELVQGSEDSAVKHKAFLVTAEGRLIQKGKGVLAPSEKEVSQILKSAWMKDLVIDAALLRGQVVHPDRLLERLKDWKGFYPFWKKVVEAQPNPEIANQAAISKLVDKVK